MYISKFQVFNYKSFKDSTLLEFEPGINIIIGQNNAGKTAFLEALELNFKNNAHRNIRKLQPQKKGEFIPSTDLSTVDVTLNFSKIDLYSLIEQSKISLSSAHDIENNLQLLQNWIDEIECHNITIEQYNKAHENMINLANFPKNLNLFNVTRKLEWGIGKNQTIPAIIINEKNELGIQKTNYRYEPDIETFEQTLLRYLKNKIYRFESERFHIGSCSVGTDSELNSNARNLAEVIHYLQNPRNKNIYKKFNSYVNKVFPDIASVSADLKENKNRIGNNECEVLVWSPEAEEQGFKDFALPLSQCGTGVSQVLAILYVVVTASEPQVIIIDEPQSFLHPSAIKKLIEILKEFPQHQYFIATHSSQIITAADPATIVQLSYIDGETTARIIDVNERTQVQSLLNELGVSLSDIFGADNILWVEGPTEEKCFPLILERLTKIKLRGTKVLAVASTGDLEGKHANLVFDIYDKLSGGNSLFPPAIGFIFDDEGRKQSKKDDLIKRSNKKLVFLERRLYENYLLDPKAIAHVINNQEDYSIEPPISENEIQSWLDSNKNEFMPKGASENVDWLKVVDGAKLLGKLFSEKNIPFIKTKHSYKLTEWLVENKPECLQEIVDLLEKILAPHP